MLKEKAEPTMIRLICSRNDLSTIKQNHARWKFGRLQASSYPCARTALFIPELHDLSYHSCLGIFLVVPEDTDSSKLLVRDKPVVF